MYPTASGPAAAVPPPVAHVPGSGVGARPPQQPMHMFRIGRLLGRGSFGDIYQGFSTDTGAEVAIKVESKSCNHPQLKYEAKVLSCLSDLPSVPRVHYYAEEADHSMLVMDLLGPTLEELYTECGRRLSRKTVLMLADQMICRIQEVHNRGFIHRDIKPENFLMGRGERSHIVYMIDFGLAKRWFDPKTSQHIPQRKKSNLTGTARYASVETHRGSEQSRRDDLECLGYVLAYFEAGGLPWQGLKAVSKEDKYAKIAEKKQSVPVEQLSSLPEVVSLITYARSLGFEDTPDYDGVRRMFLTALQRDGAVYDCVFDWTAARKFSCLSVPLRWHGDELPPAPGAPATHLATPLVLSSMSRGHSQQQQQPQQQPHSSTAASGAAGASASAQLAAAAAAAGAPVSAPKRQRTHPTPSAPVPAVSGPPTMGAGAASLPGGARLVPAMFAPTLPPMSMLLQAHGGPGPGPGPGSTSVTNGPAYSSLYQQPPGAMYGMYFAAPPGSAAGAVPGSGPFVYTSGPAAGPPYIFAPALAGASAGPAVLASRTVGGDGLAPSAAAAAAAAAGGAGGAAAGADGGHDGDPDAIQYASLASRLKWQRLPPAQQARLESLLLRTEQLVALQQRLVSVLCGTSTPTRGDASALDEIDRDLVLLLSQMFPPDG